MLETLKPEMVVQQFVVKHYTSEERPTIKGNGFDGLEVGEDREDAEEFVGWLNERFSDIDRLREELDTHLKVHLGVVRENIRLRRALKSLVDWTTEKTPGWAPLEQARAALAAESETPLP
jgi:hypothetical protein